jgi:cell division protein YceG involved in septum cleavage
MAKGETMKEKYHATLQPSETAIFQAAAHIFASYAASGKVTDENENDMILKAIKTSITICSIVEKNVRSDEEIS